jgi:hypothetical protein
MMKCVPARLRPGQLVIVEWLDASGGELARGDHLAPVHVRTVGWVWERKTLALTIYSEEFLDGHVEGGAREAMTIHAQMLRKVRVISD